jgi:hypothetical protein
MLLQENGWWIPRNCGEQAREKLGYKLLGWKVN